MKKSKIAFVVQRYGIDITGGSEYECRMLAEHLRDLYDVDVFTNCARDYAFWDNYYEEGCSLINGVNVYRFPNEKRKNLERLQEATIRMNQGIVGADMEWLKERGPYCPKLIEYVRDHAMEYKKIFFMTYDYYTTVMGLHLELKNSVIVPTAHDEPNIYKKLYIDTLSKAKAILYNSVEERDLIENKLGIKGKPSRTTCMGLDIPEYEDWSLPEKYAQYDNYIIYVGRVSKAKNFQQLNNYFIQYKSECQSDLKLLVIGKVDNQMILAQHEDIVYLGFVSEEEKVKLIRNAKFLVMPSRFESLSIVILESMMVGRPVLVNADCAVLKGQCVRSNAGLYYENYTEFKKSLNYLLENQEIYDCLAENGKEFVKKNYSWNAVVQNLRELIEEI